MTSPSPGPSWTCLGLTSHQQRAHRAGGPTSPEWDLERSKGQKDLGEGKKRLKVQGQRGVSSDRQRLAMFLPDTQHAPTSPHTTSENGEEEACGERKTSIPRSPTSPVDDGIG